MPGENCAVFGCGSCRRTKGIGIWKLPSAKEEAHLTWKKGMAWRDQEDEGFGSEFQGADRKRPCFHL